MFTESRVWRGRSRFASVIAVVALSSGCAAARDGLAVTPMFKGEVSRLEVANHYWHEIRVYLVHGYSVKRFVGTVFPGTAKTFELQGAMIGEPVQLLLQPTGARSEAYLIPDPVTTGSRIVLHIENILNRSRVFAVYVP